MDRPNYPTASSSLIIWSKWRVQVRRYFNLLGRLWWLLPLTISLGVCIAAWVASQIAPTYLSISRMMVSGQINMKEGAVYSEQADNFYGTQVELMQSKEVQIRAMTRVQALHPELAPEIPVLQVSQIPRAAIFVLRVEAPTAPYAQAYLDAVMDEYIDTKRKLRLQTTDSTTGAIADELARLEKDIDANDVAMHEFQKENNIGFLQQEGNDAATYLAQKNRELADLKSEANLLQMLDLDQNLDRERSGGGASGGATADASSTPPAADGATNLKNDDTFTVGPIAEYAQAKHDLELLKMQVSQLSRNLRPKHPAMVALDHQIERQSDLIKMLRVESDDQLKSRRESLQLQIQNLENVIKEWEAKALVLSGRISEFNKIKAKSDRDKEQYEHLLTNMNSVTVTKNIDQDTISILERASPGMSVKPGLINIIGGGFGGGLFIGLLILFVVDKLDDRINSLLEVETNFNEAVLGHIPKEKITKEDSLLKHDDERQALLEAFRSLRSSLIFLPVEGARPKSLIITSALPNEGKTTVSSNLAITLAFSGARTLIIDADMRRGKLSRVFGVEVGHGLSSVLLGTMPWQEIVQSTSIDNLSIIPCGPPLKHPAEHLLGQVADRFLKEIYKEYDYILFDSPPVNLLDDTLSLSPKVDGTLVVVRFGVTSMRATGRALDLLRQRQTNILGVVCNDVPVADSDMNYGYYYSQTVAAYHKESPPDR